MKTLFIAVMILGCAGALTAQKVNPNQIQPGVNGTCLYTNGSGVVVWQNVCGTVTLQTNGTNNTSQTLLSFTNTNGVTWSNPSGGVEEVNVNLQLLGGPPTYQRYCVNASGTNTVTCTFASVTQGDLLLAVGTADNYGASLPTPPTVTDSQGNLWTTDVTQQANYFGTGSGFTAAHVFAGANGSLTVTFAQTGCSGCSSRINVEDLHGLGIDAAALASGAISTSSLSPSVTATTSNDVAMVLSISPLAVSSALPGSPLFSTNVGGTQYFNGWQFSAVNPGSASTTNIGLSGGANFPVAGIWLIKSSLQYNPGSGTVNPGSSNALAMYPASNSNNLYPSGVISDAAGDLKIPGTAAYNESTVASANTISPTTQIFELSGTSTVEFINPPAFCNTAGYQGGTYGCWLLAIPTGASKFSNAGLASTGQVTFNSVNGPNQPILLVYDPKAASNYGGWLPAGSISNNGSVALASGTATVSTAAACAPGAGCIYKLTQCGASGAALGAQYAVGAVTAGTSFVINALSTANAVVTTDTSTICWQIN